MIDFLITHMPWWVYLMLAGVIVVGVAILWRSIGLTNLIALAVAAVAAVFAVKMVQKGYGIRDAEDKKASDKVKTEFDTIHEKHEQMPDTELDRANTGWVQPDPKDH